MRLLDTVEAWDEHDDPLPDGDASGPEPSAPLPWPPVGCRPVWSMPPRRWACMWACVNATQTAGRIGYVGGVRDVIFWRRAAR